MGQIQQKLGNWTAQNQNLISSAGSQDIYACQKLGNSSHVLSKKYLPMPNFIHFAKLKCHQNLENQQAVTNLISSEGGQGAVSIRKTVLPGMAIPMLKIRRPNGRLIFNMEITIRR